MNIADETYIRALNLTVRRGEDGGLLLEKNVLLLQVRQALRVAAGWHRPLRARRGGQQSQRRQQEGKGADNSRDCNHGNLLSPSYFTAGTGSTS